jgi:hypothetical protein
VLSDFTRFVYRRIKKYARVLLQQGRVPLDPDLNEDAKPAPADETLESRHEREE